ncbi:hypothetical protein SAMN02949497_2897 [Methylomagnum ishizawai]|uniref:Uncharacterized protein n=1 Tax=Methylomagnum ishizawai TaxID=1760988 RepID=A0A1Y6D4R4_9GAMM|nr:hypothetical protein [Methylomagnum ishizawai]SMF95532.1 hypothetical protein SAMN02949497_2897 [Methylomagnum ishizawai]
MNLDPSLGQLASDAVASPVGNAARCEAANFRWERAISVERAEEYGVYVGAVATHKDWKAEHNGYAKTFVHVAKDFPRSSESFMALNAQAHLNEKMDNAFLLRLESIGYLFGNPLLSDDIANRFWNRFFNSQKDLRKEVGKLSDSDEALRTEFVRQWNTQRTQARPLFATFLNDFGGDLTALAKADWPHLLRDRLGLTHWPSTPGKSLPVALMCYTLDEVRDARALATKKGAVASFARPTVLDTEMSAAFVPAPLLPGGESYGYTLDLANTGIPGAFTPELLTFPIDYRPSHIKALGFILRPHALQDEQALLAARNRHVQGLQAVPGGDGFGEVLL